MIQPLANICWNPISAHATSGGSRKFWWGGGFEAQNLKNSDVFTKIESDFSAELGNSNVFFAQIQVVSKKKKKKKKRSSPKLRVNFRPNSEIQTFFSPKFRWSPKKKGPPIPPPKSATACNYFDSRFKILTTACSQFHLSLLKAVYILRKKTDLCRRIYVFSSSYLSFNCFDKIRACCL